MVAGGPGGGLVSTDMSEPVAIDLRRVTPRGRNLLDEPRLAWDDPAAGLRQTVHHRSVERDHVEAGRPRPSHSIAPPARVGIPADLEPVRRLEDPVRVTLDDDGGGLRGCEDGSQAELPGMVVGRGPSTARPRLEVPAASLRSCPRSSHGHPWVAMSGRLTFPPRDTSIKRINRSKGHREPVVSGSMSVVATASAPADTLCPAARHRTPSSPSPRPTSRTARESAWVFRVAGRPQLHTLTPAAETRPLTAHHRPLLIKRAPGMSSGRPTAPTPAPAG